jgi:signal peptidase II
MRRESNAALFWPVIVFVAVLDVVTKAMAVRALVPQRVPHEVVGEYVRLTLVYNPGAAFGLHLGSQSRWIFTALTLVALVILGRLYQATQRGDTLRVLALALVCAGAVGNLIDRLRSDLGVVDFLDVGLGTTRWPTFNVADMAVSVGAILLAWVLWQEDRAISAATESSSQPSASPTGGPYAGAVPADRGEPV